MGCPRRPLRSVRAIDAFNKYYKTNVLFIERINNPTLNNAWLSGFTDAVGCFTISVLKRSDAAEAAGSKVSGAATYNQVTFRYMLSQQAEYDLKGCPRRPLRSVRAICLNLLASHLVGW
jgi:hypothetical protein